jgi:hypothetical protein
MSSLQRLLGKIGVSRPVVKKTAGRREVRRKEKLKAPKTRTLSRDLSLDVSGHRTRAVFDRYIIVSGRDLDDAMANRVF